MIVLKKQTIFLSEYSDKVRAQFLSSIMETSVDGLVGMSSHGCVVLWNHSAELMFGWSQDEAIGQLLGDLIVPHDLREAHAKGMAHYNATGNGPVVNKRIKMPALHKSGNTFLIEMTVTVHDLGGKQVFFAFLRDLSERNNTEAQLREVSLTDELTNLPNRRHLQQRLQETMIRVMRTKRLISIMYLDIDHFKSINDGFGHEVGDHVLKEFAKLLCCVLREVDFIARLGGGEFIVIVEEQNDQASATIIAQKIIESMSASPFEVLGHVVSIATSIGVAFYQGDSLEPDELIRRADQAMYRAKRSGRNTFRVSHADQPVGPVSTDNKEALGEWIAKTISPEMEKDKFLQDTLHAVRAHLGMDVGFISEFVNGNRVFRYVDAASTAPPISVGDLGPLDESYCQRVVDGRLPEIIPDAFLNTHALTLPVTKALPVRAHISVPIKLKNGHIYGTFCFFSFTDDQSLNQRDASMMHVFADLIARQLESMSS